MTDIMETMQRLRELGARKRELMDKLDRSLAIQALWPEAFALGPVTTHWRGIVPRGKPDLRTMRLVIRRKADGAERIIHYRNVPDVLRATLSS